MGLVFSFVLNTGPKTFKAIELPSELIRHASFDPRYFNECFFMAIQQLAVSRIRFRTHLLSQKELAYRAGVGPAWPFRTVG
jgi:hypothetical protein